MAREDVWIAESVCRICRSERDAIVNMLKFDGVKSMEHYRELMGMLAAFDHVEQELKSLLNKQEQIDE